MSSCLCQPAASLGESEGTLLTAYVSLKLFQNERLHMVLALVTVQACRPHAGNRHSIPNSEDTLQGKQYTIQWLS